MNLIARYEFYSTFKTNPCLNPHVNYGKQIYFIISYTYVQKVNKYHDFLKNVRTKKLLESWKLLI